MNDFLLFHRKIALVGPCNFREWFLFLFLLPFSILYGVISWLRNRCYDRGILKSYRPSVPVVSVGNIAVGGTGKTPVVDWFVKDFLDRGLKPAVISRGYGGNFSGRVGCVSLGEGPLLDAKEAGDEPFLLAQKNPEAVVIIARKRADGVKVAVEQYGANVIILDDGFQHRAVSRDLDLVLLDTTHPCANGWPLPAGLLREFTRSLRRADALLLTRAEGTQNFSFEDRQTFSCQHQLANIAVDLTGREISLSELKKLKLFAFAGIANPESFFSSLRSAGLVLENSLSLSDHSDYDQKSQDMIKLLATRCDALITTEKDAVKLNEVMFSLPCYQVPMVVSFNAEEPFKKMAHTFLWRL